jgi:3'-5' exoribonuclease
MFPEALMLHYLDDLDSKMEAMRAHFEREAELEGPWTSYNPSLGRPLLDSRKFMQGEKVPGAKSNAHEAAEDASAVAAMPAVESQTSSVPALDLDLFTEQKA